METSAQTDKGIGLALLFALLSIGGALTMLAGPGQLLKAWGFAGAMVAAFLSVVAIHAYGA